MLSKKRRKMNVNNNKLRCKTTRWDKIRKRNCLRIRTETVRKFVEIDFIDKRQMMLLNGDDENNFNPAIVMDLRHKMINRISKTTRNCIPEKVYALERVKHHNQEVENRYIENELNKLKTSLHKTRPKFDCRLKLCPDLNNAAIYKSLEKCQSQIQDFYSTENTAMQMINNLFSENQIAESGGDGKGQIFSNDNNFPTPTENSGNVRLVHFDDCVEVINYSREESQCSNASEDVDSVISEFVDEVVNEIEFETQIEIMDGQHWDESLRTCLNQEKIETCGDEHFDAIVTRLQSKNPLELEYNNDFLKITKIQREPMVVDVEIPSEEESSVASGSESNEQDNIIADLFQRRLPNDNVLLRKYFLTWMHYTTIEKIDKENYSCKNDRVKKINAFLDKLRLEKKKVSTGKSKYAEKKEIPVVVAKKYQNKIKVQQDIIELQRLKLERQERVIMELKLSKLSEETKLAKQDVKNELKTVIRTGNKTNRTKAKSLQLVANCRDEEDYTKLQGKAFMIPRVLEKMQERALQRSIKHEEAKQRRLQLEADREAAKTALEEAKRLEDEQAKLQRIEALKEKRRQEKLAKLIKEREQQRRIENNKKCEEFNRRRLLRQIGIRGFKKLLLLKKQNYRKAENFRKMILKKKFFESWQKYVGKLWNFKIKKANELYNKITVRRAFRGWTTYVSIEKSKFLVAIDWYELKATEFYLNKWIAVWKWMKIIEASKIQQAESHFHWHLKWKVLDRWQRLPQVLKLEKETEVRRQRWRLKIWELLPDYTPNIED